MVSLLVNQRPCPFLLSFMFHHWLVDYCQLPVGSLLPPNKTTKMIYVHVISAVSWLLTSPVLSQVVADSQSSDTGTILRVRGPLEFKCQLDSTDGTFKDVSLQYILTQWLPKLGTVRFNGVPATVKLCQHDISVLITDAVDHLSVTKWEESLHSPGCNFPNTTCGTILRILEILA